MMTPQDEHIQAFRLIVSERLGLQVDDSGTEHLAEVLCHRLRKAGHEQPETYLRQFGGDRPDSQELRAVAAELAVGETFFFRYPAQFEAFGRVAVPDLIRGKVDDKPLRILSAGCASGEEAYSLAIVLHEVLGERAARQARIVAIDFSGPLLERAAQGRYSSWSLRGLSGERRERWFRKDRREYVLDEAIRRSVEFEERNIVEEDGRFWRPERFDAVFFRNVSIYFSQDTTVTVIDRIERSLGAGGYLFLGPTETLRGISHSFHLRHTHDAFYYQRMRPEERRTAVPKQAGSVVTHAQGDGAVSGDIAESRSWVDAIGRSATRIAALSEDHARGSRRPTESAEAPKRRGERSSRALRHSDLGPAWDLLSKEQFEDALRALSALPAEMAADPDVLTLRAVLLTNSGKIAEAEVVCRELLARDEMDAGAHYLAALCREHAGDRAGAVEHGQTAIYLDPGFAMARFHMGLLAKKAGDLATAKRELKDAVGLLEREYASRILLFGGGFAREALVHLCRAELRACGGDI